MCNLGIYLNVSQKLNHLAGNSLGMLDEYPFVDR